MDLVRLGPLYNSSYIPDDLIEGYSSLVWAERWAGHGDFELKTFNIDDTMARLPEDTLVSHLETEDVHIVENHLINYDDKGRKVLTVTGRSLTSFTENRWVDGVYQTKRKMARKYAPVGAIGILLYNAFDNVSGKDVTRAGNHNWSALDAIPNVAITDSVLSSAGLRNVWLTEGGLWPQLETLLADWDLGIRVIRPGVPRPVNVMVSVIWPEEDRGTIERVPANSTMALRFDVYSGVDRSETQSVNPRVVFSQTQGHLDSPSHLYSSQAHKTVAEIVTKYPPGTTDIYRNATEKLYSGLQRKVVGFDAGNPDIPDEPTKPEELRSNATTAQKRARAKAIDDWLDERAKWRNKYNDDIAEFKADAAQDAKRELKKQKRLRVVEGAVSSNAPFVYRTHYNLGDTVTLYGNNNFRQPMVVAEYIRTEDATGDKGYPGLIAPDTE